jgi:hypothetical protein
MAKTTALGWGAAGTNALDPEGVVWPGKVGSTSSESKKKPLPEKQAESPKPAPKTAPRSSTAQGASSTAGSAATSTKGKK